MTNLYHAPQKVVNFVLAATKVTAVNKVVVLLSPTAVWCVQLEVPQEVIGLLEMRSNGDDLVDQILHTNDAKFT